MQEVEGRLREEKIKALLEERYSIFSDLRKNIEGEAFYHFFRKFFEGKAFYLYFRKNVEGEALQCRSLASTMNQMSEKLNTSWVYMITFLGDENVVIICR